MFLSLYILNPIFLGIVLINNQNKMEYSAMIIFTLFFMKYKPQCKFHLSEFSKVAYNAGDLDLQTTACGVMAWPRFCCWWH